MEMKGRWIRAVFVTLVFTFMGVVLNGLPGSAEEGEVVTVQGVVLIFDDEVVLQTTDGEYLVEGINLIHHAGKTVKVTGTLEEEEGDRIIKATRFERVP
jgi:hypothetical protein